MSTLAELKNALLGPGVSVLEALHARPVLDKAGSPRVLAGNNAFVAHLQRDDGRDVALRIVAPGTAAGDWSVRYSALASLQAIERIRRLPRAIRNIPRREGRLDTLVPGAQAAQVMEWIPGPTLLAAIDRAVATGNRDVIRALAAGTVQMWNDLVEATLVHGDLTAQNIMVRADGQLAVVDLDTASWRDAPFGTGGLGTPGYRPPRGNRDGHLRDAFGMLVIQASLAAISENPGLHARFGDPDTVTDGTLLFNERDLANPDQSQAFTESRHYASPETRQLLDALAGASTGGHNEVLDALALIPRLRIPDELSESAEVDGETWNTGPALERLRAHYTSTWETLEKQGTWPGPPPGSEPSGWDAPSPGDDLQDSRLGEPVGPPVHQLAEALNEGNEAEILRLWNELQGNPHSALMAAAVEQVIGEGYERRLATESRAGRDSGVVAIADEAERRQIPLGIDARRLARRAQERLDVRADLEAAIAMNDVAALADLAVSGRLVVLGDTDRSTLRKVLQAIELPILRRALDTDDDQLIVLAFDQELFGDGNPEFHDEAERAALAVSRLGWLADARDALRRRDARSLNRLMLDPPSGAIDRLSTPERRRILKTIESEKVLRSLDEAIEGDDEAAIVSALNAIERIGARIPERKTWRQIQQIVERIAVIDDLLAAANAQPPDHARIAHLVPTVRALGLEHDPRLGDAGMLERLEEQVIQYAHLRRIRAAIARDSDIAIAAAAVPDPHGAVALLNDAERDRVGRAIRHRRHA